MKDAQHPVDYSPYLDGERGDAQYEEIRAHLESCTGCRAQLQSWRRVDDIFRSPDLELDVPQWQWSRIEARLDESPKPGWLAALRYRVPSLAWAAAASVLLVAGSVTVAVRQYRQSAAERETLVAVARFAETEQPRLRSAGNPFRGGQVDSGNPFTRFQSHRTQNDNPFARR